MPDLKINKKLESHLPAEWKVGEDRVGRALFTTPAQSCHLLSGTPCLVHHCCREHPPGHRASAAKWDLHSTGKARPSGPILGCSAASNIPLYTGDVFGWPLVTDAWDNCAPCTPCGSREDLVLTAALADAAGRCSAGEGGRGQLQRGGRSCDHAAGFALGPQGWGGALNPRAAALRGREVVLSCQVTPAVTGGGVGVLRERVSPRPLSPSASHKGTVPAQCRSMTLDFPGSRTSKNKPVPSEDHPILGTKWTNIVSSPPHRRNRTSLRPSPAPPRLTSSCHLYNGYNTTFVSCHMRMK